MVMKKITWFSALAATFAVAVGVSGCIKKELQVLEGGETCQLLLTGVTQSMGTTKADATTEPLAAGLETGIYVVNRTSGENVTNAAVANVKHVADASGALNNTEAPIILTTGWEYDMIAYGPHDPATVAADSVKIEHGKDMIWAKNEKEKPNAKTHSTALTFQHKVAQISFELKDGGEDGSGKGVDLTGATFQVTGFAKDGRVDLSTGKIKLGAVDPTIVVTEADVTPIYFLAGEEQITLNAVITLANGNTFSGVYTKLFEPGWHYKITIKVVDRDSDVADMGGTLVPWEDDEEGDLEIGL